MSASAIRVDIVAPMGGFIAAASSTLGPEDARPLKKDYYLTTNYRCISVATTYRDGTR